MKNTNKPETTAKKDHVTEALEAIGIRRIDDPGWEALSIVGAVGTRGANAPTDSRSTLTDAELEAIDEDNPDQRPVLFNPYTGQRLQPDEQVSLDEYDIQDDDQYCIWCGTIQWKHYTSWSQWVPCVEVLDERRSSAMTPQPANSAEESGLEIISSKMLPNGWL